MPSVTHPHSLLPSWPKTALNISDKWENLLISTYHSENATDVWKKDGSIMTCPVVSRSTWRVRLVSRAWLLLLGIWSVLYLFRGLCCFGLNLYFAIWISDMFQVSNKRTILLNFTSVHENKNPCSIRTGNLRVGRPRHHQLCYRGRQQIMLVHV